MTQPLIHEQHKEIGIDISTGQIDALLTKKAGAFIEEKNEVLRIGLKYSDYINVDDSGARHQGKNGYVTHIGNEAFACFSTTFSKSDALSLSKCRINFLELLHADTPQYILTSTSSVHRNDYAREYYAEQGLPKEPQRRLELHTQTPIKEGDCWEQHLDGLGIEDERHRRIATEGCLLGGLIESGFNPELVIVSDGAGQFAILLHALCWVHAERLIHKTIPLNDKHREDIAKVRDETCAELVEVFGPYTQTSSASAKIQPRRLQRNLKLASTRFSLKKPRLRPSINCSSAFTSAKKNCCSCWSILKFLFITTSVREIFENTSRNVK